MNHLATRCATPRHGLYALHLPRATASCTYLVRLPRAPASCPVHLPRASCTCLVHLPRAPASCTCLVRSLVRQCTTPRSTARESRRHYSGGRNGDNWQHMELEQSRTRFGAFRSFSYMGRLGQARPDNIEICFLLVFSSDLQTPRSVGQIATESGGFAIK